MPVSKVRVDQEWVRLVISNMCLGMFSSYPNFNIILLARYALCFQPSPFTCARSAATGQHEPSCIVSIGIIDSQIEPCVAKRVSSASPIPMVIHLPKQGSNSRQAMY